MATVPLRPKVSAGGKRVNVGRRLESPSLDVADIIISGRCPQRANAVGLCHPTQLGMLSPLVWKGFLARTNVWGNFPKLEPLSKYVEIGRHRVLLVA